MVSRGVTICVSCIERFMGSSKWKWSSISPWSGDFGVSRAHACYYAVVRNALGKGSDLPHYLQLGCSRDNAAWCASYLHFCHLADTFIQTDIQMRTIEAIKTNKRAIVLVYVTLSGHVFVICCLLQKVYNILCNFNFYIFNIDWVRSCQRLKS